VVATSATQRHQEDAQAVLQSWAAQGEGMPENVQVFLVDRLLEGPRESMLRLKGDVDLSFLHNPIRTLYLWRYLAEHHADHCEWIAKADADTFMNLWAINARLRNYFSSSDSHYLGSVKTSILGSGRKLPFTVNVAILSRGLLNRSKQPLEVCMDDLIKRKLGRGAEDIDLAYCLDFHDIGQAALLGAPTELSSRGMQRARSEGMAGFLTQSGACTLFVHPVHGNDSIVALKELKSLLANATFADNGSLQCQWPTLERAKEGTWNRYMEATHAIGKTDCWMGSFNWDKCCDPKQWGQTGNPLCWDEEYNHARCCEAAASRIDTTEASNVERTRSTLDQVVAPIPVIVPPLTDGSRQDAEVLSVKASSIRPMVQAGSDVQGNPKCWADGGFTFDLCCEGAAAAAQECWVWPYSAWFCCLKPHAPHAPIRVGGTHARITRSGRSLAGSTSPQSPTTARCHNVSPEIARKFLACTKSLDEIGVIFELDSIGGGDKASGWHDYLRAYERFLLHLPLTANVLEIGVRTGCSLAMWSEYFPLGEIVGIDKNIGSFSQYRQVFELHGAFSHDNVRVLQANASDESVHEHLNKAGVPPEFADVIVDDANHWAKDQLARFEIFFPRLLAKGGVYLIEDVHIQAPYAHDGTAVRSYFANLSASSYLTEDSILVGAHQIDAFRNFSPDWRHSVESVSFLRDMVIITKAVW